MILEIKTSDHTVSIPLETSDPEEALFDFFALMNSEGNTLVFEIDGEIVIIVKNSIDIISILKDVKKETH